MWIGHIHTMTKVVCSRCNARKVDSRVLVCENAPLGYEIPVLLRNT